MENVFYHHSDNKDFQINLDNLVEHRAADEIVTYKTVDGEDLYIAYFLPKGSKKCEKHSLFVMIHGGSWSSRNIMPEQDKWSGDYLGYLARYYADKGYVSAVLTYRLLGAVQNDERQLFDLYTDCQDALNYIADHAEKYGADLNDVTILGESAGGHLAAAMVTNSYCENRLPISRAILVNPVMDLDGTKWGRGTPEESSRSVFVGKTHDEINKMLSPHNNVTSATPECLLIHGNADSVVDTDDSVKFLNKLKEFGVNGELHFIDGAEHAFLLRGYYQNTEHTRIGVSIIDSYLDSCRG